MYTFDSRIRFSEIDHTERLTLPALVNYFQDCSIFHSDAAGLGVDALKEAGKAWVLSSWQIIVDRYPRLGEEIRTATWAAGFEGFFGHRNFRMTTADGEVLAYAYSLWTLMDLQRGRPARVPAAYIEAYGTDPALDMPYAPRKIPLPATSEARSGFPVRRCHIDTNEHVNNCQYIQMAIEVLPSCDHPRQIRAEYKRSAVLGDNICPRVSREKDRQVVELCGDDGALFATVEFKETL